MILVDSFLIVFVKLVRSAYAYMFIIIIIIIPEFESCLICHIILYVTNQTTLIFQI